MAPKPAAESQPGVQAVPSSFVVALHLSCVMLGGKDCDVLSNIFSRKDTGQVICL